MDSFGPLGMQEVRHGQKPPMKQDKERGHHENRKMARGPGLLVLGKVSCASFGTPVKPVRFYPGLQRRRSPGSHVHTRISKGFSNPWWGGTEVTAKQQELSEHPRIEAFKAQAQKSCGFVCAQLEFNGTLVYDIGMLIWIKLYSWRKIPQWELNQVCVACFEKTKIL